MKKIIYSSLLVLAITLLTSACDNDSDMNSPHGSTTPPEQVVLNGVKNLPGKSIIYFTQPSDKNFLYMKAVYMTEIGERSTNASYFPDSVVVEGFEKAGEYNVKLYSVSPGEAYSEPLEVKINPEEPPYITAYKEMEIKPDFAGIRIKTSNTSNETLTFYVYRKDATGKWTEAGALYTKKQEINEPIRGMEAVPSEFSVVVKDRWGHLSESKEISLTPYYEEEVDKKKMGYLAIGEYKGYLAPNANTPKNLYDGIIGSNNTFMTLTTAGYDFTKPSSVTLDLGKKFKLSRMIVYGRRNGTDYSSIFDGLYPKEIEIWGRNDNNVTKFDPENDEGWVRLYQGVLPRADGSVIPAAIVPLTDADKELARDGNELEFSVDLDAYRYVTFVCIKNYNVGTSRINVAELTFFGTPEDKIIQ